MPDELERIEEAARRDGNGKTSPPIRVRTARLDARDIEVGELLTIDEVRILAGGISLQAGGSFVAESLQATLIVTESALNRYLQKKVEEPLSDLQVALLNGKMRFTGRYRMLLPIPFKVTAVPEIEDGTRLRLDPHQMSLVGTPIPGFGVEIIGDKINAQLAAVFDAAKLPIPAQLTEITVETGRILLEAAISLGVTRVKR